MKVQKQFHQEIKKLQPQKQFEYQNRIPSFVLEKILNQKLRGNENTIFLMLSKKFGLSLAISVESTLVCVKGILVHSNGSFVRIPESYRSFLVSTIQRNNLTQLSYKYDSLRDMLYISNSFKFDQDQGVSQIEVNQCAREIYKTFPHLIQSLTLFGFNNTLTKVEVKRREVKIATLRRFFVRENINGTGRKKQRVPEGNSHKGCVFKFYKNITEEKNSQKNSESTFATSTKTGGFFQVEKKYCSVVQYQQNYDKKSFAVKEPRKDRETQKSQLAFKKLERQMIILNEIQNNKHSLQYWIQKQGEPKKDRIYMDYVSETLFDYIYGGFNSLENFIDFSTQIVNAVEILHQSGIIHRDLKPQNILVEKKNKKKVVKVIDFGESALQSETFRNQKEFYLGSTIPYSPIECTLHSEEAFNTQKIDSWSVGVILHELFFGKLPVFYSKCYSHEIYRGWNIREEFSVICSLRKKKGVQFCSYLASLLSLKTLQINQQDRPEIGTISQMLSNMKKYVLHICLASK